eukprot:336905-Pleurochrysis_carterae.AAC.2
MREDDFILPPNPRPSARSCRSCLYPAFLVQELAWLLEVLHLTRFKISLEGVCSLQRINGKHEQRQAPGEASLAAEQASHAVKTCMRKLEQARARPVCPAWTAPRRR